MKFTFYNSSSLHYGVYSGLLLLLSLSACQNESSEPFQYWTLPYAGEYVFYPLAWQELIILPASCGGAPCLKAVRRQDGEEVWRLQNDMLQDIFYNTQPHISGELLLMSSGRHLVAVSLMSGTIIWTDTHQSVGDPYLTATDEQAFRTYPAIGQGGFEVYQFQLSNGQKERIQYIPVRNTGSASARPPTPIRLSDSLILVSPVVDYLLREGTHSYLMAWWKSRPTEHHTQQAYPDNAMGYGATLPLMAVGQRIYGVAHDEVICYDPVSNVEIWRVRLPRGLLTSRLSYYDGHLYIASEDAVLHVLDAVTGAMAWEVEIAGTPSRVFHTKDDIFLIGGSDRLLYQISRSRQQKAALYQGPKAKPLVPVAHISEHQALLSDGELWHSIPLNVLADSLPVYKKFSIQ